MKLNWTNPHLIKDGVCVALIFSLSHTSSENTRPRIEKAEKPHQNHPFVINLSQSGKVLGGGGNIGTVHVFKSRGMMFKHKNICFSFPETLFIYFFLTFSFWGWNWQMPEVIAVSWVTVAGEDPKCTQQQQNRGMTLLWGPLSSAHSRQLCPDPQVPVGMRGGPGLCCQSRQCEL